MKTWTIGLIFLTAVTLSACGGGSSGSASPTTANTAPSADAGADQAVDEGATIQLAGSGSDPESGMLSYRWSQLSGPTVTFSDPTDPNSTVNAPEVPIRNTEPAVLELRVTDPAGASATDSMTIDISSTDFSWYAATELVKFDPETDTSVSLSGSMVAGGAIEAATLSPDGQWFAYVADQDTDEMMELYVVSIDGGDVTKVSVPLPAFGDVVGFRTAWSPDSTQLLYRADAERDDVFEVYIVDRDGSNQTKINGSVGRPAIVDLESAIWSPDGRYVAQTVRNLATGEITAINTYDTTNPGSVRIANAAAGASIDRGRLRWSPDSSQLAYRETNAALLRQDVYIAQADGSGSSRIVASVLDAGVEEFVWSPNGSQLAVRALNPLVRYGELYVADSDGTNATRIAPPGTVGDGVFPFSFKWSPDGAMIGFAHSNADAISGYELYTAQSDGSAITQVSPQGPNLGGVGNEWSWSPDGAWIAYRGLVESDVTAAAYVVRPDGSDNLKVSGPVVTGGRAVFLGWSPDSTRIWYSADQETAGIIELYTVRTDASERFKVNAAANNTSILFASWSNDSSRLLFSIRDAVNTNQRVGFAIASPQGGDSQVLFNGSVVTFGWSRLLAGN